MLYLDEYHGLFPVPQFRIAPVPLIVRVPALSRVHVRLSPHVPLETILFGVGVGGVNVGLGVGVGAHVGPGVGLGVGPGIVGDGVAIIDITETGTEVATDATTGTKDIIIVIVTIKLINLFFIISSSVNQKMRRP